MMGLGSEKFLAAVIAGDNLVPVRNLAGLLPSLLPEGLQTFFRACRLRLLPPHRPPLE
jgi:hypothetical protein